MIQPPKEYSKIQRVMYWALYFSILHATAREYNKRFNDLWMGKDGDVPNGILNYS